MVELNCIYDGGMGPGTGFVDCFHTLLGRGDLDGLTGLYAPDGKVIRHDGVADTTEEITSYFPADLGRHPDFHRHPPGVRGWWGR